MISLTPFLFLPGTNAAPTPTIGNLLPALSPALTQYQHSITARGGYESAVLTFACRNEDAETWLTRLMCYAEVVGSYAQNVFEGYVTQIEVTRGGEKRTVTTDTLINTVAVRYTTVLGTPGITASTGSVASILRYGQRETVLSLPNTTATTAITLRDLTLSRNATPQPQPATTVGTSSGTAAQVTLTLTGPYFLLDWLRTSNAATSNAVTTTQVQTLLSAFLAVNPWFSVASSDVVASGISDTQYIAPDTTYRAAIERRLQQGATGNVPLTWGCLSGRRFVVRQWAPARTEGQSYRRSLADSFVRDRYGAPIMPWDVLPDAMYDVLDLSSSALTPGGFYVDRVTCSASEGSMAVTLEPSDVDDIDVRLARLETTR